MKSFLVIFLALVTIASAACAPVTAPHPTARPAHLLTLRMEIPTDANMTDLPRLMAADALRAQGYIVEAVDLNDNTLSVQALAQGSLDEAQVSNGIAWAAIQQGASLRTIVDDAQNLRVLAVTPGITRCADLDGKQVAVPSTKSTQALLLNKYIHDHCPEAKIQQVVISGPSNIFLAVMSGRVDAGTMSYTDVQAYQIENKTKVALLEDYTGQFRQLRSASHMTRGELIEKYPETVKDIVRALLIARREIQDPDVFAANAVKYLKMDPAEARNLAQIYLEGALWDLNGGWTPENLQENLNFYVETGTVKAGLTTNDIADLSFLNAVLDEIGRK